LSGGGVGTVSAGQDSEVLTRQAMSLTEYRDFRLQSPRNATIVKRETWSFWASEVCYVYSSITRNSSLSLQASGVTGRGTLSEMSQPSADEL